MSCMAMRFFFFRVSGDSRNLSILSSISKPYTHVYLLLKISIQEALIDVRNDAIHSLHAVSFIEYTIQASHDYDSP